MLRRKVHFSFFAIFTFLVLTSSDQFIYNDGWIPLTAEQVLNQVRRGFIHTDYTENVTDKIYLDLSKEYSNKLLQQQFVTDYKKNESIENDTHKSQYIDSIIVQRRINKQNNEKDRIRKAKKIAEHILGQEVDKILLTKNFSKIKEENKESVNNQFYKTIESSEDIDKSVTEDASNIYEVTEDPITTITTVEQSQHIGYQYNSPNKKNENLTSKFINILSKYNIKPDDELQNYELSRQDKTNLPLKHNYGFPMPYNSPNHLPVDPLLAVLLSHYGVYLPGIYGINGNYKNLYGYLASNNIHNNKPFGLYKIFSDTDA